MHFLYSSIFYDILEIYIVRHLDIRSKKLVRHSHESYLGLRITDPVCQPLHHRKPLSGTAGIHDHVLGLLSDLLTTTPQQPSVRHSRESYPGPWLTSSIQIQYANHYTTANLSFSPVQFSDNTTVTKYGETFYGCLTALNEEIKVDLEIINHKNVVGGGGVRNKILRFCSEFCMLEFLFK